MRLSDAHTRSTTSSRGTLYRSRSTSFSEEGGAAAAARSASAPRQLSLPFRCATTVNGWAATVSLLPYRHEEQVRSPSPPPPSPCPAPPPHPKKPLFFF